MSFISNYDLSLQDDSDDCVELEEKTGDDLFLDLIQQKNFLYDKTLKDHSDRIAINNAWFDISTVMSETVKQCQARWERLKKSYNREKILRWKETKSGAGQTKRRSWKLFERMHAIFNKVDVNRRTYTNVKPVHESTLDAKDSTIVSPVNCLSGNKHHTKPRKDVYGISATVNNLNSVVTSISDLVHKKDNREVSSMNPDKIFGELVSSELCHIEDIDTDTALTKYRKIMNYLSVL